jgi:hypothetical protein
MNRLSLFNNLVNLGPLGEYEKIRELAMDTILEAQPYDSHQKTNIETILRYI